MSVTAMPRVTKSGKVQWHNPETHRFEWFTQEEWAVKRLELGDLPNEHRYATLIENLENDKARAQEDLLAARDPRPRDLAQVRLNQFTLAIENAREASMVTEEVVQFGTPDRKTFAVRVPPHLDDFVHIFPKTTARQHKYVATDPLEIAWLRRQAREGGIPGLIEMPVGLFWATSKSGGGEGLWLPAEQYHDGVERGVFQP